MSGGTGATPSCGAGKTAVLAPTYVAAGVGGKPTVQFAAVNVQIVSGSGSTNAAVNGRGNLVVGYAENASNFSRPGSHDLVVGANGGWTGYGEIVGGNNNRARGNYATVFGQSNFASGANTSVTGGLFNLASAPFASIAGGCQNVAGSGSPLLGSCAFGGTTGAQAVLGGFDNSASGHQFSTVAGGVLNSATGEEASVAGGGQGKAIGAFSSVLGGLTNKTTNTQASVSGGQNNTASGNNASVLGGFGNNASGDWSSVSGGQGNTASGNCQAIPPAPIVGSC